jgi:hypothetical protein
MSIGTRRPWMAMLLAAAPVPNSIGRDIAGSAFFPVEQLSWNIRHLIAIAILATMVLLE